MILPDVNLIVYAYNEATALHEPARVWWQAILTSTRPVAVPWAVVVGFIRLVTHPAVLVDPLSPNAALDRVHTWFAREHVQALDPGPRHLRILETLFAATGVAGNLTTDTHLAALAIEHQCEMHSNDTDFQRFPGLRWTNPLA